MSERKSNHHRNNVQHSVKRDFSRHARREEGHRTFWQSLGMLGMVGWPIALATVGGALLLSRGPDDNPAGGAVGWFLSLVILTEFNAIAQALWGRPFGRHKIIPEVSPGKGWEGLIGATV